MLIIVVYLISASFHIKVKLKLAQVAFQIVSDGLRHQFQLRLMAETLSVNATSEEAKAFRLGKTLENLDEDCEKAFVMVRWLLTQIGLEAARFYYDSLMAADADGSPDLKRCTIVPVVLAP
ncbi:hypothetical protein Nepgr_000183 [Nepenthes gracilis]|uniref:Uncharacterized protein n=1 Tax=Nepenthes gracilis TaxID=150966 RepID=A0AAD3P5U7_NEPGR|nr:hypothetical protein Nepgr_000183 [Nepenthes gracilis]